jgi:purine-nucleoside/S-methyl-5'-thioadenosine phosphorylase / adenosine deaminase
MAPFDSFNLGGAVGDDPGAVAANRARLAAAAGLSADRLVWMSQVHGANVATVAGADGSGEPIVIPDADGVVTATAGLGLAVLVADCVPILAADPVAGVIAAIHAGRRGSATGIGEIAVAKMVALGASPDHIEVLLGPAICGGCYEVPESMRAEVEMALPGSASTTDRGTPGLDLRAGLARQFTAIEVAEVVIDNRCTYTDPDLYSHRRGSPTGRLAGLIWLES